MSEDDDFVFKSAVISPKLESTASINSPSSASNSNSFSELQSTTNSHSCSQEASTASIKTTSVRVPALDSMISELKREQDAELARLSKVRLEEFLKIEKEADELREQEAAMKITSPKAPKSKPLTTDLEFAQEIDRKEELMFAEMKESAKETWKELRKDYQDALKQMHTEQAARLSQESQLQESLKASGAVFDRQLFERVVERCGKGRSTAYGKEKMARFWEVLDRSHSSNANNVSCKDEDDKVLASLLGLNA